MDTEIQQGMQVTKIADSTDSYGRIDIEERKSTEDSVDDMFEEVEENDTGNNEEESEEMLERSVKLGSRSKNLPPADLLTDKSKYFSCERCNYVTHIRSRYTKHVKYHSIPRTKCTMCDFQTPYKWNLDRHMKNHGGSGSFRCFLCNFTADIKQSLTVHEMNHHIPSGAPPGSGRRPNKVGSSDWDPMLKEEDGSRDSSLSLAELEALNADIELVTGESPQVSPNGAHNNSSIDQANDKCTMPAQAKRRPLPQLIPLGTSTPTQNKQPLAGEPPAKKIKQEHHNAINSQDDVVMRQSEENQNNGKDLPARKKNESFFDKLKERILTETGGNGSLVCKNCGFESKCLSELSVHEKNCASQVNKVALNTSMTSHGSTRCQNCRHRCKSSADLLIHMQTCGVSLDTENSQENCASNMLESEKKTIVKQDNVEPHPMENVVFVWNTVHEDNAKFETPLDINITDDATIPDNKNFDIELVEETDGMNLSPTQAIGKKVFKCPHCSFWATTASRFHVHIVGHLNKKPFECSLCKYKSNWRWDITKHIKLKSARDPTHNEAKVLMTDETGRRNYSKYNQFLAIASFNEAGENVFHYINDPDSMVDIDDTMNETNESQDQSYDMQPLDLHTQQDPSDRPKKSLWRCKKCNFKDPSRDALLTHVREHAKENEESLEDSKLGNKNPENTKDPSDLAYRCGHCFQISNWKHVIQRHCRLKHEGVIKVIAVDKPPMSIHEIKIPSPVMNFNDIIDKNGQCTKCPFKSNDKQQLFFHQQQHTPSASSIFKCYFCPYFVKTEEELPEHLLLHGVTEPEEFIARTIEAKVEGVQTKRHKCNECPYETNSKSQYMYHEQFHKVPEDVTSVYRCQECNYTVSKRHLLHQHMRVHGIIIKKGEEYDEPSTSQANDSRSNETESENSILQQEIPYVWVSAKNEFHKMYKCRYCSYVISHKCKIPSHEQIHCISIIGTTIYKCLDCKYSTDCANKLAEHSREHGEIYGRIYGPVDPEIPDEEQISKLRKLLEEEQMAIVVDYKLVDDQEGNEGKLLHFCQKCPARFFNESDIKTHYQFHNSTFLNKCQRCEYSVPLGFQLNAHLHVHTDSYHANTNMLKVTHEIHPDYVEPDLDAIRPIAIRSSMKHDIMWVVKIKTVQNNSDTNDKKHKEAGKGPSKQYKCKHCPAKFFKPSALKYHLSLHGGKGENKCKKCSYAVKNLGNLAKHELLHESGNKNGECDYESGDDFDYKNVPLSGTDLFQRKTEAQKRVLHDKDKLVKPNDHFPPVLQADPQFGYLMHGNPEFIYPTYLKNGRQKEKRYKCHKCPSAFEKREQYKIHLSLHGSKQRYKCEVCDYSVKYYANYVQHMRKHQMNDEAIAERRRESGNDTEITPDEKPTDTSNDKVKLAIKTIPKSTPKTDFEQFSISDQQILRILQDKRSLLMDKLTQNSEHQPTKKQHMCSLCPYSNQRQDALENHYKRHNEDNVTYQKCPHCGLTIAQSHFLKDHVKSHFLYQKHLTPKCYAASHELSFTITKLDQENKATAEVKHIELDRILNKDFNEEKIIVQVSTGEIVEE